MLTSILSYTESTTHVSLKNLLLTIGASLIAGFIIAKVHMFRNNYTKNFIFTVALLPVLVAEIIMVVNGNLGTGITVAGAFSLVRFRSAPGNAREITTIFFAMATGLTIGMSYIVYATLFTVLVSFAMMGYTKAKFGEAQTNVKQIRITVPENLNYIHAFDDVFNEFTRIHRLDRVKTTNLGSLIEVHFTVHEKNAHQEKSFLDALRMHNGNLPITIQPAGSGKDEL